MNELDLSGIDPLRRDEVRRRIGILDRYLALEKHVTADAENHAREMGIGVQQFYRLASVWRLHRDPKSVGVGKRGRGLKRRDGVSPEARAIVQDVLREVGANAPLEHILREVHRRCETVDVPAPSRGALWTYVMDARGTSPIRAGEVKRIVVGRIWARLPTQHEGKLFFPEVAIAMTLPDRVIIGSDVSCDPRARASVSLALARGLASMPGALDEVDVLADAADVREVRAVHIARFGREPIAATQSISRLLSANLGRLVGGLGILHRGYTAKPERLVRARSARPLDEQTAVLEIERAVHRHNATIGRQP